MHPSMRMAGGAASPHQHQPIIDTPLEGRPPGGGGVNMPAIIVVMLVVVGALGAWALNGPDSAAGGWHAEIGSGMDDALEQERPVLILFTADWCPPCRLLKREVLADGAVRDYLEREYVCVKVDLTDQSGPNNEVAMDFGVQGIPALHAYDVDGTQLGVFAGPRTPDDFVAWLRECKSWTR